MTNEKISKLVRAQQKSNVTGNKPEVVTGIFDDKIKGNIIMFKKLQSALVLIIMTLTMGLFFTNQVQADPPAKKPVIKKISKLGDFFINAPKDRRKTYCKDPKNVSKEFCKKYLK